LSFRERISNYSDFVCELINLKIDIDTEYGQETEWQYQADHSHPKKKVVKKGEDTIIQKTIIGEAVGGNCWNDNPAEYHAIDLNKRLDFIYLEKIINNFCPNISYKKYRKLWENLVHEEEETEREYYGNYTNYHIFRIDVKDLYNFLKENNE